MTTRTDVAAYLAAALGEAVTVVASAHRADLTPPAVTVDLAGRRQGADVAATWSAYLHVAVLSPYTGGAEASSDAAETLVDQVLGALFDQGMVTALEVDPPTVVESERHPAVVQTITAAYYYRDCPDDP